MRADVAPVEEADDEDQQHDPQRVARQPERLVRDDTGQRDREHQERERQEDVHRPADHRVDPAAEVAGDDAERRADDHREQGREERDQQRDPGAVDDPAEDVAAERRLDTHQVLRVERAERERRRGCQGRRVDRLLVELVGVVADHACTISGAKIAIRISRMITMPPAIATLSRLSRLQAIWPRERPSIALLGGLRLQPAALRQGPDRKWTRRGQRPSVARSFPRPPRRQVTVQTRRADRSPPRRQPIGWRVRGEFVTTARLG